MKNDLSLEISKATARLMPPLEVVGRTVSRSFGDASVTLRDQHILWKVTSDLSVLRLEAAPHWDSSAFFDADLLLRLIESVPSAASEEDESIDDLIAQLEQLREPVLSAFAQSTWMETKRRLFDLGRRRDAELFGRPYRPREE